MKKKRALITGITGQDGSYLAELLLKKNYSVIGTTSGRSSRENIAAIADHVHLVRGNIADPAFVRRIMKTYKPHDVYNLASVATVADPWSAIDETVRSTALVPLHFLESIRVLGAHTRVFQASSAQMYDSTLTRVSETTPLHPMNPYGAGKAFAHMMVGQYRAAHGLYAVSGILFNHESPRRGTEFVSRKISTSLAKIRLGLLDSFDLGNLDARRDWGFAGDFANAMWRSLQQKRAGDYVIGTGETHSVRDFLETGARVLGFRIAWRGSGMREVGVDEHGKIIVRVSKKNYRPTARFPRADARKAKHELGWKPDTSFDELVRMMVEADLARLRGKRSV